MPWILDPFTGRPGEAAASATIIGPSRTRADANATAAFVMGEALDWVHALSYYELLLIPEAGMIRHSAGWPGT